MKDKDCIFCKIANGEIPASTVYEDENFRVILDLGPASKGHALILPKEHYQDLCHLDEETAAKILPLAGKIGSAVHCWNGADKSASSLWFYVPEDRTEGKCPRIFQ